MTKSELLKEVFLSEELNDVKFTQSPERTLNIPTSYPGARNRVRNPRKTQINIISGEILNLIDQKKIPVSIAEIMFYIDDDGDLTRTSIDWLIRERHVHVVRNGKDEYLCNC